MNFSISSTDGAFGGLSPRSVLAALGVAATLFFRTRPPRRRIGGSKLFDWPAWCLSVLWMAGARPGRPVSLHHASYSSYTLKSSSSTILAAMLYPSCLGQDMQSCSGSLDSALVSRSTKPERLPRSLSLASPPDFATISFIFVPFAPMIRRATRKSSSLSMPMKNRHVYLLASHGARRPDRLLDCDRERYG